MSGIRRDSNPGEGAGRVAIYFRMFGPYILARIGAAAARMPTVGLEGARRSSVYRWEPRDEECGFERRTLFTDKPVDDQTPAALVAAVERELDAVDPEVVCISGWSHGEALTMLRWARRRRRHVVLLSESTAHDAPRVWWREAIKRTVVGLCDAALVGGKPQRAYVETLGMASDRVFVGYDAVDNDYFAAGAAAARSNAATERARLGVPERYFLASSRFIAKKNLPRLVQAYAAYRARAGDGAWDLVLVGDGEERPALEAEVARLGVGAAVHFMGFRQYEDLPAFYGLAGAFVHVSTVEQWGLVVNEAMAAGLPVVVSQSCGCAEDLVMDGVNGWRVDPLDPEAIAARLFDIAAPATDRAAMGASSRRIVADYGPDRFGDGLAAAVAAAKRSPPRSMGPLAEFIVGLLTLRSPRDGS